MDLIHELGPLALASRLKRLSERLLKDGSQVYKNLEVEFEARWFPVVYLLKDHDEMAVTEVATKLGLTHPAVNQVAGDLERHGLLVSSRDREDERRRLLSLSAEGHRVVESLEPVWADIRAATAEVLAEVGGDLLAGIEAVERCLDEAGMYERVMMRVEKRNKAKRNSRR